LIQAWYKDPTNNSSRFRSWKRN